MLHQEDAKAGCTDLGFYPPDENCPNYGIFLSGFHGDSVHYGINFKVVRVYGWEGPDFKTLYSKDSDCPAAGLIDDPTQAFVEIEGYIRWDGCMDVNVPEDAQSLHFCSWNAGDEIGKVLNRVVQLSKPKLVSK